MLEGKDIGSAGEAMGFFEAADARKPIPEAAVGAGGEVVDDLEAGIVSLEALLLSRAYLYELFHKLFGGNPTAELVEQVFSDATLDAVDEYVDADESMRGMRRFLEGLRMRSDYGVFADEALGEFTRLFIGPGRPEALPIESPYLTKEAALFQANTVAVREEYAASGYRSARCTHVPDDHLSLMCCYMGRLGARSLEALWTGCSEDLSSGLRTQQSFVLRHMANWLPDCAKAARSSKTALLYPQMLEALSVFVNVDATFLGEAAFWVEGLVEPEDTLAHAASHAAATRPESFATFEEALSKLRALRLFGLADNELVEL